jgi:hypothetical protein
VIGPPAPAARAGLAASTAETPRMMRIEFTRSS